MSNVVDVIPTGATALAVLATEESPIDLFNRQEIIDRIIHLLSVISDKKESKTLAINGVWGSGKTFVLDKLMRQLLEYRDGETFLVFHYNCWQYDYYEEPLVAIVAAMLDSIDQESHLFGKSLRANAKRGMAMAKPILKRIATGFVKNKIGIDLSEITSVVKDCNDAVNEVNEQEASLREYDEHFSFNKTVQLARTGIQELSKDRTVVVVVDELDRCLPSYAIKVLERLHHLFTEVENVAVILAVDKTQLDYAVQQIFGNRTDSTKYLRKFIDFEVKLNIGKIESGFREKYSAFLEFFDETTLDSSIDFDDYVTALFEGVDARTQERMMEKIRTVHTMLFPKSKKDYSFLCFELMWLVFSERLESNNKMPLEYVAYDKFCFTMRTGGMPKFSEYLQKEWVDIHLRSEESFSHGNVFYRFLSPVDIKQLIVWYLWQMYPNTAVSFRIQADSVQMAQYQQNLRELKDIVRLLEIIE